MIKIFALTLILSLPLVSNAFQNSTGENVENCCLPCAAKGNPEALACVAAEKARNRGQAAPTSAGSGVTETGNKAIAVDPSATNK